MTEEQNHDKLISDMVQYSDKYIREFNEKPEELNQESKEQGYGNYLQLKTLNVILWPDEDLKNTEHARVVLGTYSTYFPNANSSVIGWIKINLKAHKGDFEKIKGTIRHEIAHAIAHQIYGVKDSKHNEVWMEIAKEHDVDIDQYINKYKTEL